MAHSNARRLVWVTGQSGAGKTTLAMRLRRELDWTHFDADVFAHGGDPVRQEGSVPAWVSLRRDCLTISPKNTGIPTEAMRAARDPELKRLYDEMVEKGFLALFRGADVPLDVWTSYYDVLCDAVARAFAASTKSMVVSMAVYPRALRAHIREKLPGVTIVALNEVGNCGASRKVLQVGVCVCVCVCCVCRG